MLPVGIIYVRYLKLTEPDMAEFISDIAFTPAVKAEQEKRGSRDAIARLEQSPRWTNQITPDLSPNG